MVQIAIEVEFGNTQVKPAISLANNSPSDETHISLTITDPALNIDPTTADKWRFNVAADPTGATKWRWWTSDCNGPATKPIQTVTQQFHDSS